MFDRLADDISLLLVNHNVISNDDRESYIYGLKLFLPKVTLYLIIFIIALVLKAALVSTLFILMYMGLRKYTGGYHCKTAEICLLFSILIYLIFIFLFSLDKSEIKYGLMIASIISLIVILIFSPIENENRPLENIEKNNYRVKSIVIATMVFSITVTAFLFEANIIFYSGSWSLTADAVLIVLNLRRKNGEKISTKNDCCNG